MLLFIMTTHVWSLSTAGISLSDGVNEFHVGPGEVCALMNLSTVKVSGGDSHRFPGCQDGGFPTSSSSSVKTLRKTTCTTMAA